MSKIAEKARKIKFFDNLIWKAYELYSNMLRCLPDVVFANVLSLSHHRGLVNITHPVSFNEKLWWLKKHYRNPLEKICSDKYLVHEYLKGLGEEYDKLRLPMVDHFEKAADINISSFNFEVIMKLNVGSGANIIIDPANPVSEEYVKSFFSKRMKHNYYLNSREWNFQGVKPIVVVEKVLRDSAGHPPVDYKFLCFFGKPELVFVSQGTMDQTGRHSINGDRFTNVYDMDWNLTEVESSYPRRPDIIINKPDGFEKMKKVAANLSRPFPHVRIDLYDIDGNIFLGEFTFYHSGGCGNITPREEAIRLGNLIDINKIESKYLI